MITAHETRQLMATDPQHWLLHLMDFVDDFRYFKDPAAIAEPFELHEGKLNAMLASTSEYLCDELGFEPPSWLSDVPALRYPWFVSGIESLKAIAIVESPLRFKIRQIFVLENFLSRV